MRYAQIDAGGVCIAVSNLAGEVTADNLILLADNDNPMGMVWDVGAWSSAPLPPSPLVFPVVDFMELFGAKQMAVIAAATTGSPVYDWEVSALWNRMTAGQNVRYDNPLVAQGMAALVAKSLITQAEADLIMAGVAIA